MFAKAQDQPIWRPESVLAFQSVDIRQEEAQQPVDWWRWPSDFTWQFVRSLIISETTTFASKSQVSPISHSPNHYTKTWNLSCHSLRLPSHRIPALQLLHQHIIPLSKIPSSNPLNLLSKFSFFILFSTAFKKQVVEILQLLQLGEKLKHKASLWPGKDPSWDARNSSHHILLGTKIHKKTDFNTSHACGLLLPLLLPPATCLCLKKSPELQKL